jgi:predicted amidophosphoribosyltransferase
MPTLDPSKLNPRPAGFGRCGTCPYREYGTTSICYACAREEFESLADERCKTCDHPFGLTPRCANPICSWDDRWFAWNYAIAMRTGALHRALNAYKFDGKRGWARIFGRVLAGFLEENDDLFGTFDIIVANPCYEPDPDHRGPLLQVLDAARDESERPWPFDAGAPPVIIKTVATESMKGKTWQQRFEIARGELRESLRVTNQTAVAGKNVLVFDDIFTSGLTLNEVAGCLREAGAEWVCGVSLARQSFRG